MGILWEGDRHVFRNAGNRDASLILQDMEDFTGSTQALETSFENLLDQEFNDAARPRAVRIHVFDRNPFDYVARWSLPGTVFPPKWWEVS